MPSTFFRRLTLSVKMAAGASLCLFLVLPIIFASSQGMNLMQDFRKQELQREEQHVLPSPHREMLGKVQLRRTLEDTSRTTPTITSTPTVITVPATFPVSGTPTDPTATPVPVSSTTPVTLPPANPVNTPAPVTNPVTPPANSGAQPVANPVTSIPPPAPTIPVTNPVPNPTPPATTTTPATAGQGWCVAKTGATQASLQAALDYACGVGSADCSQIQPGTSCYNPNTLQNHASYAFNSYYQKHLAPTSCDFGGTATLVSANPSSGSCNYPSSSTSASPSTPSMLSPPSAPSSSSPQTSSAPATTTPISTPASPPFTSGVGAGGSGSGTPPGPLNSTITPAGMAPLFGGSDAPPTVNTTSSSTNLQPFISRLILVTSFSIGKLGLLV